MGQYRTLKLGVLGVMMLGSSVTVNSAVVPEKVVFGYSMDGWPVSSSHWVQGETAGIGAGFVPIYGIILKRMVTRWTGKSCGLIRAL